jgi:hypothetical protein
VSGKILVLNARRFGAILAAGLIALSYYAPASAASWLEKQFYLLGPGYSSVLPSCENEWALGTIQHRFAIKEDRFWNSHLRIEKFDQIKEVAFRPWAEGTIPRRFCRGKALTSDGQWRNLRYSIIEDGGIIGATFGVEWCVVGADRNWAYNPNCNAAAP